MSDPTPPKTGTVALGGDEVPCIIGDELPEKKCHDRTGKINDGHKIRFVKLTGDIEEVDTTVEPHKRTTRHYKGQTWELCPECADFKKAL